jgi:hypothetical protein
MEADMAERLNIAREVAALKRMTVKELRGRYVEVFGEATRSGNKDWLWKRIAWRMQANAEGGLTERARRRAEELANDADLRLRRPPNQPAPSPASMIRKSKVDFGDRAGELMPGTVLTRPYKGQTITVTVLDGGFEFEGDVYRSLSAIAKAITGSHWNGNYFFGVKGRRTG